MPRPAATPRAARMALLTAPFAGKAPSGRVWRRLRRARGSAQLEASGHRQVAPRGRYRPLLGTRQASFASSSWPLAGFRPRTRVGRARRALDCLRLGAPSGCRAGGLDARPNHGRHREPGAVAAKGDQVGEWSHVHLSAPDTGCCAQSAGASSCSATCTSAPASPAARAGHLGTAQISHGQRLARARNDPLRCRSASPRSLPECEMMHHCGPW
jgi:hypothetical protein